MKSILCTVAAIALMVPSGVAAQRERDQTNQIAQDKSRPNHQRPTTTKPAQPSRPTHRPPTTQPVKPNPSRPSRPIERQRPSRLSRTRRGRAAQLDRQRPSRLSPTRRGRAAPLDRQLRYPSTIRDIVPRRIIGYELRFIIIRTAMLIGAGQSAAVFRTSSCPISIIGRTGRRLDSALLLQAMSGFVTAQTSCSWTDILDASPM